MQVLSTLILQFIFIYLSLIIGVPGTDKYNIMKNVMIFQDYDTSNTYGHQWKEEELFKYFKCQIDNSINFGWKPEDICIVTNLDFEYRDVTIIKTKLLCTYNKYFNK